MRIDRFRPAALATSRKPGVRPRLRQAGRRWVRPRQVAIAWANSRNACRTIREPACNGSI